MVSRKVRNTTASDLFLQDFGNQKVAATGDVNGDDIYTFINALNLVNSSTQIYTLVSTGDLIVLDASDVDMTALDGWKYLTTDREQSPMSEVGNKIWVHQSSKPQFPGKMFHTVWTGVGDDNANDIIGAGEQLLFDILATDTSVTKDVYFDVPDQGDVYIHEGYFMWDAAPWGATISVDVVCQPTLLQTAANLDLELVSITGGNKIKYAAGGAGTGTHGWASVNVYIVPTYLKTGHWNYDVTNGLTPNITATGNYDIYDIEKIVLRFINKVPVYASATGFNRLQSSDTAQLAPGYFLRATVSSDTTTAWKCWMFMTLHRERTV